MDVLFLLEKSRTDRFEPSNATVRWTVAGDGLTEPNLNIFFPKERKYVTNLAGTCLDEGYLKCTLITVFDILRQKDVEFFYIRNNNLILFHYTDGITDIILHYSIHMICYCVDEEVNYRRDDIIEEV